MWQSSATGAAHTYGRMASFAPPLTPYRYAYNNPVRYHDPTGLFEVEKQDGGEKDPPKLPEVDGLPVSVLCLW